MPTRRLSIAGSAYSANTRAYQKGEGTPDTKEKGCRKLEKYIWKLEFLK
jgi:hypothetical protein